MEIRFIVDTQLPPSLAEFLRRRSFDATHVSDYPLGALMQDSEIIEIAKQEERIIITKDSDFRDYYLLKGYPPSVLILQLGNIKNRELFSFLDLHLNTITMFYSEQVDRLIILQKDRLTFF